MFIIDHYIIFLILFFAGFIQAICGLGFGLVAMSLLPFVIDIHDASILLTYTSIGINVAIVLLLRSNIKIQSMKIFLLFIVAGVPLGILFLRGLDKTVFTAVLGVILVSSGISLFFKKNKRENSSVLSGAFWGFLSGTFAGAFGIGGPSAAVYIMQKDFTKYQYTAAMQISLAISAIARIIILCAAGMMEKRLLTIGLTGLLFALVGVFLGLWALQLIPQKIFRTVIKSYIIFFGLWYICKALNYI